MSARLPRELWRVASAQDMRFADLAAAREFDVSAAVLMECAGRAAVEVAQAEFDLRPDGPATLVLVGPGNNGGDGLVVARTLLARGLPARALFIGALEPLTRFSGEAFLNHLQWQRMAQDLHELTGPEQLSLLAEELESAGLVVDGLFGTGLSRPLAPGGFAVVEAVNASDRPVLALDLPSGLHADTGEVLGTAIRATRTACFAALKPGLREGAGPEHAGEIDVLEIGLPAELLAELPPA